MLFLAYLLCLFVILFHIVAGLMEILRGPKMIARLIGPLPEAAVKPIKTLLINQGVYNLFLAAGLIWAVLPGMGEMRMGYAVMFLMFVTIAGVVGYHTTGSRVILFGQAAPAIAALALLWMT